MDFELTDEQRLIQETVRTFVDERVLPVAIQNDIDHKVDMELIEGMAELGILGIVVPEEYGGAGLDYVAEALACEEIERGEAAFRTRAARVDWLAGHPGAVAEWLRSGLQSRLHRFDSGRRLSPARLRSPGERSARRTRR